MSGIPANQEQELRELVAKGEKIAAIALYRKTTGVSLKEAKDAIEAIARGVPLNQPVPAQINEPDPFLEIRIKRLLVARKKIEAVKIYREAYNWGLKDAKDAVDLIQAMMQSEGFSHGLSTTFTSDDPFTNEAPRNRRRLIISVALLLVVAGALTFFFILQSGI
jgi:ribosomal protein L7/L12